MDETTKKVWDIQATEKNLTAVFAHVWGNLADENGRGEIDAVTGIMRCVEWAIENLLESEEKLLETRKVEFGEITNEKDGAK